jgi:hypothetical protein
MQLSTGQLVKLHCHQQMLDKLTFGVMTMLETIRKHFLVMELLTVQFAVKGYDQIILHMVSGGEVVQIDVIQ